MVIAIGVEDINYVCRELEENGCKVITKPKIMQNSTTFWLLLKILMDTKLS